MSICLEDIRNFILGNPLKIANEKTIQSYFIDSIVDNSKFAVFLGLLAVIVLASLLIIVASKGRTRGRFYLILAGVVLIYSGLSYRYAHLILSFDAVRVNSFNDIETENNQNDGSNNLINKISNNLLEVPMNDINDTEDSNTDNNKRKLFTEMVSAKQSKMNTKYNFGLKNLKNSFDFDDDEDDLYMSKIVKTFEEENDSNKKMSEIVDIMKSGSVTLKNLLKKFDKIFDCFYCESMKIEKEMSSFNANIKNFNLDAKEIQNDIKIGINLCKTVENLVNKPSTDNISSLFGIKSKNDNRNKNNTQVDNVDTSLTILTIYFIIQISLFLYFIVTIICGFDFSILLRIMIFLCLVLDITLGVYIMIYSHFLDKICVVGNVNGCRSTFTNGFAEFAATTGLNLKTVNKSQKDKMYSEINRIQTQTDNYMIEISNYIEFDPIQKFKIKQVQFNNMFDKIEFIFEDFDNLTNHKVDKENFFKLIKKLKKVLEDIGLTLETQITMKDVLKIYSREVAFLAFIKSEKENLYRQVDKQMTRSRMLNMSDTEKDCWNHKRMVCHYKKIADNLWAYLLIGGLVLIPFVAF
ncbi:hypothetical protein A0H76_1380 [Hepatospora eriocheir]|uniref:Uncharacterized protein n=1 Tax=Hepatospora eriocheir TaxID=1081669 RepID=A0A1X0QH57_9MICR|nr:hypothetical protein A0H76_1380 [Hepatospora eriocheir]